MEGAKAKVPFAVLLQVDPPGLHQALKVCGCLDMVDVRLFYHLFASEGLGRLRTDQPCLDL